MISPTVKREGIDILIAEDSPVQAKKLKFLLEENGYTVRWSTDGEKAIKAIEERIPDVVISDIVMPSMDGYTLCGHIKTDPVLNSTPVILLTSLRDPLDIIKGLQAGADNFISKPFEDNYLLARIESLLQNRELLNSGNSDVIIEIAFRGEKYQIHSGKKQILDLLLSVYEAAVQRNEELVTAQAELQKLNEDLVMVNQELDAFAHTVSHDLRSPLNIIMGYLQIIRDEKSDILDSETQRFLDILRKSASSMAGLIEDLLNFSRSARTEVNKSPVDLGELSQKIIRGLRLRDPDRVVDIEIADSMTANADPQLMQIVLENLLNNAWKYTSKTLHPLIQLGKEKTANGEFFFVQDNGDGFHQHDAVKLFHPFQRLHSSQEFPGTGVGLATVRRIIERHGGRIWAVGEKGSGARFIFSLPA
jgi:signal transduction histidine kinase